MDQAAAELAALQQDWVNYSPAALELACWLAPAVRIEPQLLRYLRLELLPDCGPWVEADVWFSPLVQSRSPAGIVLKPSARQWLWARLAEAWQDPGLRPRAQQAQALTLWLHRELSPALALEERVAWGAVTGDWAEVEAELARVLKALSWESRPGLAAWAGQALNRLPPEVFHTPAGQAFRQAALRASLPYELTDAAELLENLPRATLGIRRQVGLLEIGRVLVPDTEQPRSLPVPDTHPRLVEVVTVGKEGETVRRLAIVEDGLERIEVGAGKVLLRNALREEYAVERFANGPGGEARLEIADQGDGWALRLRAEGPAKLDERWELGWEALQLMRQRLEAFGKGGESGLGESGRAALFELLFAGRVARFPFRSVTVAAYKEAHMLPWEWLFPSPIAVLRLPLPAVISNKPRSAVGQALFIGFSPLGRGAGAKGWPISQQAELVTGLLREADLTADSVIGAGDDAAEILKRLFAASRDMLHIAAAPASWGEDAGLGIDLGNDRVLTARDIAQLSLLPQLVFIHLARQAGGRDEAAKLRRYAHEFGSQLAEIGVEAVAIGYAPPDAAATQTFIETFYRVWLDGGSLAEASRAARCETARRHPDSGAWAGFQVYGGPEAKLQRQPTEPQAAAQEAKPPGLGDPLLWAFRRREMQLVPKPGLFRVEPGSPPGLHPVQADAWAAGMPSLLLIHSMASSTAGTFDALFDSEYRHYWDWLGPLYGGRILAFEYWGVTRSPLENALDLAEALPAGANLHVLGHSVGGVLGELLCRGQRLGGPPIDGQDLRLLDDAERAAAAKLGQLLAAKRFNIERFIRVAAPLRGSELVSGSHKLAEVLNALSGFFDLGALRLLGAVTDASRMPGLRSIKADAPLVGLLNRPDVLLQGDLSIVAGAFRPASLAGRLQARLFGRFHTGEHDLVVETQSMYGGSPRSTPARYVFFAGADIHHFSFYRQREIAGAIAQRLQLGDRAPQWKILGRPDELDYAITVETLRAIMPRLKQDKAEHYFPHLLQAMQEFDITANKLRVAAFLAEIAYESDELRAMREIWKPTAAQRRYEGNTALGNSQPGDGQRFLGRGPFLITGRANYQRLGDLLNLPLVATPEIMESPEVAFRVAAAFWKTHGLNELADRQAFDAMARKLSGGNAGLDGRRKYYEKAKQALAL